MGKDIIFTSYFTTKKDIQIRKFWNRNDISLLNPLYDSVVKLGLQMIIFHDSCDQEFIDRYSTDKITFHKYMPEQVSVHNERFRGFYFYMKETPGLKGSKILCLDCRDLELFKNPFPLIEKDTIFIGSEEGKIGGSEWIKDKIKKAFGEVRFSDKKMLNCGILGGYYDILFRLLDEYKLITDKVFKCADMGIMNVLIHSGYKYITGYPIHTKFNAFEYDQECYIRHK